MNGYTDNLPLVSVIIPTYYSFKTIGKCLESILRQTFKQVEVIVVDNFSSDGTKNEVSRIRENVQNISIMFFQNSLLRSEARNFGAEIAKGRYLLLLDSDMELSSQLIEECFSKCETNSDAIIIPEVSISGGYWSKSHSMTKSLSLQMSGYEGIRFIRKNLFDLIGGFNKDLVSGEDFDLFCRLRKVGGKIGRATNIIFHHEENLTLRSILNRYIYYAKSLPKYYSLNKKFIDERESIFNAIFKKRKLFLNDPIHGAGWFTLLLINFLIIRLSLVYYNVIRVFRD